MMTEAQVAELTTRIRRQSGVELAALHEQWREQAHLSGESAMDEEGRIRSQALSVVHRELAALWRDDEMETRQAVQQESEANDQ
jgi:hypothetical protein